MLYPMLLIIIIISDIFTIETFIKMLLDTFSQIYLMKL